MRSFFLLLLALQDMAVFLNEEQMVAYQDYRTKLKSNMQGM